MQLGVFMCTPHKEKRQHVSAGVLGKTLAPVAVRAFGAPHKDEGHPLRDGLLG
jgi:hypothetical protein